LVDHNYLYTLSLVSNTGPQGFRLYDLGNVVQKEKDYSYLLTDKMYVGCQGMIDYSPTNGRILFQQSFDYLLAVPVLHRNTSTYIGMKPREHYLATRVKDGKLIALSDKGNLYAWDMITGKQFTGVSAE
jgi:hypothetical protein